MASRKIADLIIFEKEISIDKAIKATKTYELVRTVGERVTLQAFSGAIIMSTEFFNTGVQMSESQAVQTASLIIEQYPYETFQDLVLCLKNAKIGRYGKIYRVDGQTIFEWFRQYLDEKYERFEQIKHQEKVSHNAPLNESFLPIAEMILTTKQAAEKIADNVSNANRISEEKFYETFKKLIKTLSIEDLKKMRSYYSNENENTFFKSFTKYVGEIDEQIKKNKPS